MKVQKSNKQLVGFNRNKIIQTCMSAGAPLKLAAKIASEVKAEGYDGITTDEIRMRVYIKLKKINPEIAEQYVYRSNLKVRTSSSSLEYFQEERIVGSLMAETRVDRSFAERIAREVAKELGRMRLNYVTAPLIREIVNVKLLEHGMESVRARYTRLGMPLYDVRKLVEEGSREIAQYSPEAVHKVMSDQIAREYALMNVLPIDLADAHLSGQIHIHDLNYFTLRPTTFSHDLRFFLRKGLKVDGTGEYTAVASPAKHPTSAFMHALKVLIAGQTECSREQYIEDFNFILAPYIRGLDLEEVKQLVQMLFYEIYQTGVGKGGQAIYATLCCDTAVPKHLRDVKAVQPDGRTTRHTYADFAEEAETLFNAILDVGLDGDSLGKPFIYPKLKVNMVSKPSGELMEKTAALASKFGLPYFLDTGRHYYGFRRGTAQHVSINLPQLGYKPGRDLFNVLENRLKKSLEVLLLKRKVLSRNLSHNLLPFLKQKAAGVRYYNPNKQLYVISYTGLNELVKQQSGSDLKSKSGGALASKILKSMMKTVDTFRGESELDIILTGAPKGVCYTRFAALDALRYKDKFVAQGGDTTYYSKTHYVNTRRLNHKLRVEGRLNRLVNGRTITHLRLSDSGFDVESLSKLINRVLRRKGVGFLTMSRDLTFCSKCGRVTIGFQGKCSACKSPRVSMWSRDTGHLENVRTWNPAQRQAYLDDFRYNLKGEGVKPKRKPKRILKKY